MPQSFALTLPRRHALYLVHAPMRRARAIAETRNAPQFQRLAKPRTTSHSKVLSVG
jgi:hypothetical protein